MIEYIIQAIRQQVMLSPQKEHLLHVYYKTKTLRKDALLRLDADDLAYVATGLLMKIGDTDGQIHHFVGDGDFIIYPAAPLELSFRALEDCTIVYIHHHELLQLIDGDRHLLSAYHKLLLYWSLKRNQGQYLLHLCASERKNAFYERFRPIAYRIPHKYIAAYLDISPSYFSQL